jgi:enoyl-CoA hydratase/carnithine racemase
MTNALALQSKLTTLKLELLPKGILVITLNREKRRNGCECWLCEISLTRTHKTHGRFTERMSDELVEVYAAADVDRAVNIVVLTGAGEHFCVGADLALETSRDGPLLGKAVNDSFVPLVTARDLAGRVVLAVLACRKPSIAAINGTAVGVGITMTLAM